MRLLATLTLILTSFWMSAQGNVQIIESSQVRSLFDSYVSKNKSEEQIKGWKIQIISTDDRRKMERAKSKFSGMYPDIPLTWSHIVPYYQVRIGGYEKKEDLMSLLMKLKEDFPTATPVRENINKFDLINY